MGNIIKPVKKKLQRLLLFRFLGAILVPAVLLTISISFSMLNINRQYFFAQKEVLGTHAVRNLFDALIDLQKIRELSYISPKIAETNNDAIRQKTINSFKNHFSTPGWKQLSNQFGISQEISEILFEVNRLSDENDNYFDNLDIFVKYSILIERINGVILMVADHSNLILDTNIDDYYLIDVAIRQIPDISESFSVLQNLGSVMITNKSINKDDKKLFEEKISILHDQLRKFKRIRSFIRRADPEKILYLKENISKLDQITPSFSEASNSLIENRLSIQTELFFQMGSETISILHETFHITMNILESSLDQRISNHLRLLISTLIASIVTTAAIFYFAFSFYRLQKNSYQELENISITDPLTSIPNRRHLDTIFNNEILRARRDGKGIAFGLLDIDFFKLYNDGYGHHEGDLALQKVAKALKDSLQRAGDFYFRFGGEEFCFLFNSPSVMESHKIGERIRTAVESLGIVHTKNTAGQFITISIGIAFLSRITDENLDYIIKQADTLLYKAKNQGRNRCITEAVIS